MAMMKRKRKRKGCSFCQNKNSVIDYKDIKKLERYLTDRGKIFRNVT